jgi:hypothetical protein
MINQVCVYVRLIRVCVKERLKELGCTGMVGQGGGYMIHESGRWSEQHQHWFFLPVLPES